MGCDVPTASPVSSQSSLPPAVNAPTVMPSEIPPASAVVPGEASFAAAAESPPANPPAAQPQAQPAVPSSPAVTASATRIQLSTGVALAQTLPDGTSVLCSIDYQWVSGGAQQGVEYVWVIELGNGQRMSGPANVSKRSGTVQAILRGVKPDQGPFKAAVFMKRTSPGAATEPISDFINLTN
jgi:hypothetical protein